jgi:starch-binding outer membrane protein, SusD/RagB family
MAKAKNTARYKGAVFLLMAASLVACNKDKILTVTDPDIINPSNLASAEAAEALRVGAISRLSDVTGGLQPTSGGASGSLGEGIFHFGGAVADEWRSTDTFVQRDEADSRAITESNAAMTLESRGLNRTRVAAIQAIPILKQYKPQNVADVGQMYWIKGWAEMSIAENFCNGSPISSLDANNAIVYGEPETNVQIYNRALLSFDTAVLNAPSTEARGDTVKWMAAIEKARVQLDLGQVAGAGTTINAVLPPVAGTPCASATANACIPDAFRFTLAYSQATSTDNQIWALNNSAGRWMPANGEGPLNLNPRDANGPGQPDVRVPICIGNSLATATSADKVGCRNFDPAQTRSTPFDNGPANPFLVQLVWPTREADISIVTATEAHLIKAEVALRSGDDVTFLNELNYLRANFNTFKQQSNPCNASGTQILGCPVIPAGGTLLPPLVDPGSPTAREDLLFRERGFWLWSTGHRLPDLRRLVRPTTEGGFGRAENTVFPNGPYYKGGVYGSDKFLRLPVAEANNPQFRGCLDNNA